MPVAADVVGLGSEEMDPESLARIVSAYPRLDFVEQMRCAFLDEARRHPEGAFAELERTVALSTRFAANPIDRATGPSSTDSPRYTTAGGAPDTGRQPYASVSTLGTLTSQSTRRSPGAS
jgi:hypothetical protein